MKLYKPSINRTRALLEASYPAVITLIWIWAEPIGHDHYLNNAFLAVNLVILVSVIYIEGLPTPEEAGIGANLDFHFKAIKGILPVIVVGIFIISITGHLTGTSTTKPRLYLALLTYPLWAFLQDAIVFIFVLPRAQVALGKLGYLYTAILFSIVHLPSPLLTTASFILITLLMLYWRWHQSLFSIALAHGILGAISNKTLTISMRIGKAWFAS